MDDHIVVLECINCSGEHCVKTAGLEWDSNHDPQVEKGLHYELSSLGWYSVNVLYSLCIMYNAQMQVRLSAII